MTSETPSTEMDPVQELRRRARKADSLDEQIELDKQASMLEKQRLRMVAQLRQRESRPSFPAQADTR